MRLAGRAALTLLPLLAALAGCSAPPPGPAADPVLASLRWDRAMGVAIVPQEPNEPVPTLHVAWGPDTFAVAASAGERDLDRQTLAMGAAIYTSNTGMGWTSRPRSDVAAGYLSNRLLLWDLRGLLQAAGPGTSSATNATDPALRDVTATGQAAPGIPFRVSLTVRAGEPVWARVDSPMGREAPYRFTPLQGPFDFPLERPGRVLPPSEASAKNGDAYTAHGQILRLLRDYATHHAGGLPDRVDPQSLAVELAACRCAWPTNPFDGKAVGEAESSGHLRWTKCAANRASYAGYGWDGPILVEPFGGRCPSPA